MRRLFANIGAAALLTAVICSCEREHGSVSPSKEDLLMDFGGETIDHDWTPVKANVEISDDNLWEKGFGVFAYYTGDNNYTAPPSGTDGVVLNNRKVYKTSSSASTWLYGAEEYWPLKEGEKMSFFAYAPWTGAVSVDSNLGPYLSFDDTGLDKIGDQTELLRGVRSTGMPYKDISLKRQYNPETDSYRYSLLDDNGIVIRNDKCVQFDFRHTMAKMKFTVTCNDKPHTNSEILSATGRTPTEIITVFLLQTLTVEGINGSAKMYLNNTEPEHALWDDYGSPISWDLADGLDAGLSIIYSGEPLSTSSSTAVAAAARSVKTGANNTPASVMPSGHEYMFVIPTDQSAGSQTLTVTASYYKLSFYRSSGGGGSGTWRIYREPVINKSGTITRNFEDGYYYTINISLGGAEYLDLTVTPLPWSLKEQMLEYNENNPTPIQYIHPVPGYYDRTLGERVYINSRMGKFEFKLAEGGKYVRWQAELICSEANAFAFTDEEGHYLMEGGSYVRFVDGPVDESVMSVLNVRATEPDSESPHEAILRIYGIDSDDESTVLLNLVSPHQGFYEWIICQEG